MTTMKLCKNVVIPLAQTFALLLFPYPGRGRPPSHYSKFLPRLAALLQLLQLLQLLAQLLFFIFSNVPLPFIIPFCLILLHSALVYIYTIESIYLPTIKLSVYFLKCNLTPCPDRRPPRTFFIVCHFLLILHYIKHGIAVMYGPSDGQTFAPNPDPDQKSEIEFCIFVFFFVQLHIQSIDNKINYWSLGIIRYS